MTAVMIGLLIMIDFQFIVMSVIDGDTYQVQFEPAIIIPDEIPKGGEDKDPTSEGKDQAIDDGYDEESEPDEEDDSETEDYNESKANHVKDAENKLSKERKGNPISKDNGQPSEKSSGGHGVKELETKEHDGKMNLPSCSEDRVIGLMKELHEINPEGVVIRATETDKERLCSKLSSGLANIDHFMVTCDPSKDRKLYTQLIKGVQALDEKLCTDEHYMKEYMKHHDCFRTVGEKLKDCVSSSGWSEGTDEEYVCSEYLKTANCFYIKTAVHCGKDAAPVMKDLVKFVVGSVLTVHCKGVDAEPDLSDVIKGGAHSAYFAINIVSSALPCATIILSKI